MTDNELAQLQAPLSGATSDLHRSSGVGSGSFDAVAALAWAAVGIPMLWGVWVTLKTALALFR